MGGAHKFANWDDMVAWFVAGLGLGHRASGYGFLAAGGAFRWTGPAGQRRNPTGSNTADDHHDGSRWHSHWDNGWFAIAPGDPDTSTAKVVAAVGIPAAESLENSVAVGERVAATRSILRRHGNYGWLTEKAALLCSTTASSLRQPATLCG